MPADRSLSRLLEELEQDAERLVLEARDAEVADLARAEYSQVHLVDRLHASVGALVAVEARGGLRVRGEVTRAGDGWVLLAESAGRQVVVALAHVVGLSGVAEAAVVEQARGAASRLRITSVLRTAAGAGEPVTLTVVDGAARSGRLRRVGADFIELGRSDGAIEVLPVAAVVAMLLTGA